MGLFIMNGRGTGLLFIDSVSCFDVFTLCLVFDYDQNDSQLYVALVHIFLLRMMLLYIKRSDFVKNKHSTGSIRK